MRRSLCLAWVSVLVATATAAVDPKDATLYLDLRTPPAALRLSHGARSSTHGLEFSNPLQHAEWPFSRQLDGIPAMTIGCWVYLRRSGEQSFLQRDVPEVAPQGERLFRPREDWVNFVLGTDPRGFLLGTIHGNGLMPFPHVTLAEVPIHSWSQLVVVKDAGGFQSFYHNGTLVHTDREAAAAGIVRPFRDQAEGAPLRLAVPLGGTLGEIWILSRPITAAEVRDDFLAKRGRYHPAHNVAAVALRDVDPHPAAGLWKEPPAAKMWARTRERLREAALKILGPFPKEKSALEPQVGSEEDCGAHLRRKISIQVQPGDRMPAWMLIPKQRPARVPAILCFYGTTSGAGKDTTVGLSGPKPNTPPARNRAFALDVVEAGYVAFAADYLRDGERIRPGRRPYDTTDFYAEFPDWSVHGKDIWDSMRAIDYLLTLPFVDSDRIGMMGHSYGGHSTIFTTAFEPRIKVAVANGPVSDFVHHGAHWAVPKGAASSQSMPALRPYLLDGTLPLPITFYEFTALIAPRPLWVGQAVGEWRPMEEENCAAVRQVYEALGHPDRLRYQWYAGDHDFPPHVRRAAIAWFKHWFEAPGINAPR